MMGKENKKDTFPRRDYSGTLLWLRSSPIRPLYENGPGAESLFDCIWGIYFQGYFVIIIYLVQDDVVSVFSISLSTVYSIFSLKWQYHPVWVPILRSRCHFLRQVNRDGGFFIIMPISGKDECFKYSRASPYQHWHFLLSYYERRK